MKSLRLVFVVTGLLTLISSSCQDLGEGLPGDGEWAIYRLSDVTLFSEQVRNVSLSQLSLGAAPFISVHDIRWYRWNTHSFEYLPHVSGRIDSLARYGASVRGVPFKEKVPASRRRDLRQEKRDLPLRSAGRTVAIGSPKGIAERWAQIISGNLMKL